MKFALALMALFIVAQEVSAGCLDDCLTTYGYKPDQPGAVKQNGLVKDW